MKKLFLNKVVSLLLILGLSFSVFPQTLMASELTNNNEKTKLFKKNENRTEYSIETLKKVAQYHLDTFYLSDQELRKTKFIVTDTYMAVYNKDDKKVAYIISVKDDRDNEIGYVMVGSNNESPIILEASIHEPLLNKIEKENSDNKKLIYLGPVSLGYKEKQNTNDKELYTDVRKRTQIKVADVSEKDKSIANINKSTVEQLQNENKEKWDKLLGVLNEASLEKVGAYAYISPTVYEVEDEPNFVKMYDYNKGLYAYGGNQSWYVSPYTTNSSCGSVAAANITAYLAQHKSDYYGGLYNGSINNDKFYKYEFINHMEKLYDNLKPGILGVPTVESFIKGVTSYINKDAGSTLIPTPYTINASTYATYREGVTDGLKEESPVAVLFWEVENWELDPDFSFHWITITKYFKDNNTGNEYFACSSWGKRYSLSFYDYWWNYWVAGGVYYL